jgi:hypothetical protein
MSCPAEGAPPCAADDAVGNAATLRHFFATSLSYMRHCCTKFGPCLIFVAAVCFIFMNVLFTACNWDQIKKVAKLPNPNTALWISLLHD